MAANEGWYSTWFANGWFPSVWFAPGDESEVPPEELQPNLEAPVLQTRAAGSGYYPTGQAWVKKDHGWVKATKATRYGLSNRWVGEVSGVARMFGSTTHYGIETGAADPTMSSRANVQVASLKVQQLIGETTSKALAEMETRRMKTDTPCGTTGTLGMDEVLAVLEMMGD